VSEQAIALLSNLDTSFRIWDFGFRIGEKFEIRNSKSEKKFRASVHRQLCNDWFLTHSQEACHVRLGDRGSTDRPLPPGGPA
jgi:hypothetical protein